jgi:hypothetical protein
LGEALISGGPYLTDLNISYSPQGYTTTFAMKTWDLDFGRIKKYYLDMFRKFSNSAVKVLKERGDRVGIAYDYNKSVSFPERVRSHSSSSIIAGVIEKTVRSDIDGNVKELKVPSISIMPAHNIVGTISSEYEKTGVCSLDALFVPFSCDFETEAEIAKMDEAPKYQFGTQTQLNPVLPFGRTAEDSDDRFYNKGTTIHAVARGSDIPPDLNTKLSNALELFEEEDPFGVGSIDIRSIANKTPSVTAGYGYTVNGEKTPKDGEEFDIFDSTKWKVGPDLKVWDDKKKVWMGGFPILKGLLLEDLTAGSLEDPTIVKVLRIITNYVKSGNLLSTDIESISDTREIIIDTEYDLYCEDDSFTDADKGSLVYYINIDGQNIPIYVACGASDANLAIIEEYES